MVLWLFGSSLVGVCQDTIKAKEIDAIANIKRKKFLGRLDRIKDTTTSYQYDVKTKVFYGVEEYIRLKETRTVYRYSYYNGELIKVSVCHCWKVKKSEEKYADYYFANNQLIHKEESGMLANNVDYFLQRGNLFLRNALQRFLEPKFKDVK